MMFTTPFKSVFLACISLGLSNAFSFGPGFQVPSGFPGDIRTFLQEFYGAVDASNGAVAVSYFTDTPTPKVVFNDAATVGKVPITNLFNKKVADATYDKVINGVSLLSGASASTLTVQINAIVTKTPKTGGYPTKQSYTGVLHFLDSTYVGKLFELDVSTKNICGDVDLCYDEGISMSV